MTDPFSLQDSTSPLVNIATGVVLPKEITEWLVKATDKGIQLMEEFIDKRLHTNGMQFWEPITRLNIKTFSSTTKKLKAKDSDGKFTTIGEDRDLFQRLLVVAMKREVNFNEILSYELSAVPVSLFHPDGSLRKTTKSVLLSILEEDANVQLRLPTPPMPTTTILDGMALVQMLKSAGTKTFGEMAKSYYGVIAGLLNRDGCQRVDVVFDQYLEVSIKGGEREKRGESRALEERIYSQATPVPKLWQKYIAKPRNKENLCAFLSETRCTIAKESLDQEKHLVLAGGFKERERAVLISHGHVDIVTPLLSDHEEADTRILLHVNLASSTHQRIVIHSPDTDVAILSIAHYKELGCKELWFRTGVKDRTRFIPIHSLSSKLGDSICTALPAFHAMTGCDTTSAISGVGKQKAWKVLHNSPLHQRNLAQLGREPVPNKETLDACEAFICSLYISLNITQTADELRYQLFCQGNKKSEGLPPTSDSLAQHSKRVNFQCYVWQRALEPNQALRRNLQIWFSLPCPRGCRKE